MKVFRALYIQCYDGPDRGKGLVITANGDNAGLCRSSRNAPKKSCKPSKFKASRGSAFEKTSNTEIFRKNKS